MLKYKLDSCDDSTVTFAYFPEGTLSKGKVVFSISGERLSFEDSPDDPYGIYRYHAFSGIDISKDSGTVAWY